MFQRVLAALDGSPRAADVLASAVDVARGAGGTVYLFHVVVVPPEFPPAAATSGGDPLPAHLVATAKERLAKLAAGVRDVPCTCEVVEGHSEWRLILEAAEAHRADLIVIGCHAYDLVDRILGTTAARIVNVSPRDVLVVRPSGPAG